MAIPRKQELEIFIKEFEMAKSCMEAYYSSRLADEWDRNDKVNVPFKVNNLKQKGEYIEKFSSPTAGIILLALEEAINKYKNELNAQAD